MIKVYQSLLLLLTKATNREMARQVQFLQTENQILRSRLPKRIIVTARERRRLLKFGKPLGSAIKHLITIVAPVTFARWVREAKFGKTKPAKAGRKRKLIDVRKLIVKLAKENSDWGYSRILGELHKLTKQKVSRQFVKNVLKEHGFDPRPKRGEKTWNEFLKMHKDSVVQCDFFSKKAWTLRGVREFFLVAFLHVGTRKVWVTKATTNPTADWVREQAKAFLHHAENEQLQVNYVGHDRDTKFGDAFDDVFKAKEIQVHRNPYRSPNLNAFVERWIGSIQIECLNHFVALGEKHLNHLVETYVNYFLQHRPHQGLGNLPVSGDPDPPEDLPAPSELKCERWLGGLLKSYSRKAA